MESEGKIVEPMLGVGDRIGGYTIERLLGKGGMGAVYLVHGSDGRRFALKVMKPDDGDAHGFRARFAREAEFAMNIRHYESHKTYTGTYREQRPISGAQFDNNIFQSLMKSALQQAADELLGLCRPGRSCKIRVTPVHTGT